MSWRRFWRTALLVALAVAGALYGALVVVDPYDSLRLSPPLARAPVSSNQRFAFPALARKPDFDSAIIGTSTTRLLRPGALNRELGGAFVNLSMNSGTAHEQARILELFARHHPGARAVVVGIDGTWCRVEDSYPLYTNRPFPPWMYDEDPWNDLLHIFNLPAIEEAGKQLAWLLRIKPLRYGLDGYTNFLPPEESYDLERARGHIYGPGGPKERPNADPPVEAGAAERASWRYATHRLLAEMLAGLPAETLKVLLFVPYHQYLLPGRGTLEAARLDECKRRILTMVRKVANAHVLDFMIRSEITGRDENYWDPLHYSVKVADLVATLIGQGVRERRGRPGLFAYLGPDGPG